MQRIRHCGSEGAEGDGKRLFSEKESRGVV